MKFSHSLTIFGQGPQSISLAIKKVLGNSAKSEAVLILDYTGRGALVFDTVSKPSAVKTITWVDLADRRTPVAMFNIQHSKRIKQIMFSVFRRINEISSYGLPESILEWCAEVAASISKNGLISLSTIIKSLLSPDARHWSGSSRINPEGLGRFLEMLAWSLEFPIVYAMSEGVNKNRLSEHLKKKEVVWIEAQTEHFERLEYQLAMTLLDASLDDTFSDYPSWQNNYDTHVNIVHLFPPLGGLKAIPLWIKETANNIYHICVHNFNAERPLHPLQLAWAKESEKIWVIGKIDALNKDAHRNWLSEKDMKIISNLHNGHLWLNSNIEQKSVSVQIGSACIDLPESYKLRIGHTRKLKSMPVRQMSSAARDLARGYACCDIYPKLCSREILRLGWLRVRMGRKNSHGTDNVTIEKFKQNIENELFTLENELKSRRYCSRPLRRCYIPKEDGKKRSIGIACIRDRVVQATCLILLEPIFEPIFSTRSFAFRPRRNAKQAVSLVKELIDAGKSWAVIADIKSCFDSIDHSILINLIAEQIKDHDILDLIRHWLNVEILEFRDLFPAISGVPQGESISPLLANIYLDQLDKHFEEQRLEFVRYADDVIILAETKDDAIAALQIMKDYLYKKMRLQLKESKTNYISVEEGFDFLGFHISNSAIEIKQRRMFEIKEVILEKIRALDNPSSTLEQRISAMTLINSTIRGFRNYFFHADESKIAEQLKALEESTNQMAHDCLSSNIIADPAWTQREKFYDKTMDTMNNAVSEMKPQALTSGYPENTNSSVPTIPNENCRDYEKCSDENKRYDCIDDTSESNGHKDVSVIENNGRLYVLTHGAYLAVDGGNVVIKKKKVEIYRRSMSDLYLVYLQGMGMNISINLQLKLAELDIPIVFAPPVGPPSAILNSVNSSSSFLRGIQAIRRNDPEIISVGLNMLAAKVGNQSATLNYFSKYRKVTQPTVGEQLSASATKIKECSQNIRLLNPELADVRRIAMGLEGQAAAIYWQQITKIMPVEFCFTGRITRAAKDIVNQCFNYVYGILYGEVWRAVVKAGLDPYFGLMHGSKKDQGSLVFDLIEEFRAPFADRLVIAMIGRGFQPGMSENGFLRSKTRKQLVTSFLKDWYHAMDWRSLRISPSAILVKQAHSLAKLFNREGDYHAFKMRW